MKCKHGKHPEYCLWCERITTPESEAIIALQRQLGVETVRESTKTYQFDFFPEILGIARRQLIGLLEQPVDVEPRPIKKKFLKSRSGIENQITEVIKIRARIKELKQLIAESEDTIHGLGKKVMERRRANNPDDILDDPTRERFKREEKNKIADYEQEKRELKSRLRKLNRLKRRLANWGAHPEDYDVMTTTEDVVVTFEEKFELSKRYLEDQPSDDIDHYLVVLSEHDLLKDLSRRFRNYPTLDQWRYLENEIIFQAIRWGLIRPTKDALIKYPRLRLGRTDEPEEIAQDDTENALILKTGGAQIGASIYNFGYGRRSGSFDNTVAHGNKDTRGLTEGFTPPGEFFPEVDSGDFGERYEE
jgi:hypothetical protein